MNQRVVVVGYCASGKSTVAAALQERGVDAHVVGQEHSAIHDLWNHPDPDVVVFLDVGLDDIRARRDNPNWPEWIYDLQQKRLADARQRADLVIDTSDKHAVLVVSMIVDLLERAAGT